MNCITTIKNYIRIPALHSPTSYLIKPSMETDLLNTEEKARLTKELLKANSELALLKKQQKQYAVWLDEISFIISHKVRSSIAHIQGISSLFDEMKLPPGFATLLKFIKRSAQSLSLFTVELSSYIDKRRRILKDRFL